jgi:hypothetical protein
MEHDSMLWVALWHNFGRLWLQRWVQHTTDLGRALFTTHQVRDARPQLPFCQISKPKVDVRAAAKPSSTPTIADETQKEKGGAKLLTVTGTTQALLDDQIKGTDFAPLQNKDSWIERP